MENERLVRAGIFAFGLIAIFLLTGCGDGAFKRQFTMKGLYSVCKPDGYPVVCFADADGKEGGLFCMPLSEVGGKCQ
ncbi:MAG: hypothetical protein DI551_02745 [Micavibrio aeruginosavorus]|uniref:Lipoprotein n=1 Tax=Micavibrio aeruginosavorus TaxID=349221 RepID=A0A2W5N509_9BACT|nr:MAG: hypothetical protein DI551_02745 [Micavibrio aeruginosavorus]